MRPVRVSEVPSRSAPDYLNNLHLLICLISPIKGSPKITNGKWNHLIWLYTLSPPTPFAASHRKLNLFSFFIRIHLLIKTYITNYNVFPDVEAVKLFFHTCRMNTVDFYASVTATLAVQAFTMSKRGSQPAACRPQWHQKPLSTSSRTADRTGSRK